MKRVFLNNQMYYVALLIGCALSFSASLIVAIIGVIVSIATLITLYRTNWLAKHPRVKILPAVVTLGKSVAIDLDCKHQDTQGHVFITAFYIYYEVANGNIASCYYALNDPLHLSPSHPHEAVNIDKSRLYGFVRFVGAEAITDNGYSYRSNGVTKRMVEDRKKETESTPLF